MKSFKIVLVGDTGVGKTSVISSLLNRFSLGNSSTIGASFYRYNDTVNKINLDLWDTAGQERFRSIVPLYYKNANIYLIVFDITKKKTLKNIKDWILNIQQNDPIWSNKKFIIIGNKSDLINNFDEEKQRRADLKILEKIEIDFELNYTSALECYNIKKVFNDIGVYCKNKVEKYEQELGEDDVTQNLRNESKSMFNYKIWYRNDSPSPNDNTHTIVLKEEGWYDYLWSKTPSCNIL